MMLLIENRSPISVSLERGEPVAQVSPKPLLEFVQNREGPSTEVLQRCEEVLKKTQQWQRVRRVEERAVSETNERALVPPVLDLAETLSSGEVSTAVSGPGSGVSP